MLTHDLKLSTPSPKRVRDSPDHFGENASLEKSDTYEDIKETEIGDITTIRFNGPITPSKHAQLSNGQSSLSSKAPPSISG
jgi:hypothetical protein